VVEWMEHVTDAEYSSLRKA